MIVGSLACLLACIAVEAANADAAPVNLTPPELVSGNPVVGSTLTVSNGTWGGSPTAFSYAWFRCNTSACSQIDGATAMSYRVVSADLGSYVTAEVLATNGAGSTWAGAPTKTTIVVAASMGYHYTAKADGACTNVSLPQGNFFNNTVGEPNALGLNAGSNIIANAGGVFRVGWVATGQVDVVVDTSANASLFANVHVGGPSIYPYEGDGPSGGPYVRAAEFTLATGSCSATAQASRGTTFLCYSQWQLDPGAWSPDQAADLLDKGYWLPIAESSYPTHTKIGDYWLSCNGTQTGQGVLPTDPSLGTLDDSGVVSKPVGVATATGLGGTLGHWSIAESG